MFHPQRSSQVRDRFTRRRPRGAGDPPRRPQRMDRQPAGRRDPLVGGAVRLVGGRSGASSTAAQENRLLKSADSSRTWTSIASFVEISSVHVSPASASTLYPGAARSRIGGRNLQVDRRRRDLEPDPGREWRRQRRSHRLERETSQHDLRLKVRPVLSRDDGGATWSPLTLPGGSSDLPTVDRRAAHSIRRTARIRWWGLRHQIGTPRTLYPLRSVLPKELRRGREGLGPVGGPRPLQLRAGHRHRSAEERNDFRRPRVLRANQHLALFRDLLVAGLPTAAERRGEAASQWVPQDSHTLYAGTISGVYRTRDSGAELVRDRPAAEPRCGQPVPRGKQQPSRRQRGRQLRLGQSGAGPLDIASGREREEPPPRVGSRPALGSLDRRRGPGIELASGGPRRRLARGRDRGRRGRPVAHVAGRTGTAARRSRSKAPTGSQAVFRFASEALTTPGDVSVGADGSTHLLWTHVDGEMLFASVDAAGNATRGPTYGPYGSWTAIALAHEPDGLDLGTLAGRRRPVDPLGPQRPGPGGGLPLRRRRPRRRGHHGRRRRPAPRAVAWAPDRRAQRGSRRWTRGGILVDAVSHAEGGRVRRIAGRCRRLHAPSLEQRRRRRGDPSSESGRHAPRAGPRAGRDRPLRAPTGPPVRARATPHARAIFRVRPGCRKRP